MSNSASAGASTSATGCATETQLASTHRRQQRASVCPSPSQQISSSDDGPESRRRDAISSTTAKEYVYSLADSAISEWLKCPICLGPFVDPVSAPTCEHTFCRQCIDTHLSRHKINRSASDEDAEASTTKQYDAVAPCPSCRSAIMASRLRSAPLLVRNMVDSLLVKCPHHDRGCSHMCERSLAARHVERECRYAYVGEYTSTGKTDWSQRRNSGRCDCGKKIFLKDQDNHRSSGDCNATFVRCPHPGDDDITCGQLVPDTELQQHLDVCAAKPISCPDCDEALLMGQIALHEASCRERTVTCPLARFGCAWTGRRRELGAEADNDDTINVAGHLGACTLKPLEAFLLLNEAKISQLEEDNARIRLELATRDLDEAQLRSSLAQCMQAIGLQADEQQQQRPSLLPDGIPSDNIASPPSDMLDLRRGRSYSAHSAQASTSTSYPTPGTVASSEHTVLTSVSAPAEERDWLWPTDYEHDEERSGSQEPASEPRTITLQSSSNLTTAVSDLYKCLNSLTTQVSRMERRLEDAHVVGHNAAFEAGRAHDELNSVRHGMHAMRLQLHSVHLLQQQQRGASSGRLLSNTAAVGSTKGSLHGNEQQGDNVPVAVSPGQVPPIPPFAPRPGMPPMMGLRRYWTGFEQTRL